MPNFTSHTDPAFLRRCWPGIAVLLFLPFGLSAENLPDRVDFNFHIRPILSDRCFKCHGPDAKSRKAELRLDTAEGATAWIDAEKGLRPIAPGHPEKSEVVRRITSTDPVEMMPPPDSHLKLSQEEITLIRQWVEQGAEYKPHWAFLPVQKTSEPGALEASWVRNPIDAFVLERLRSLNLKPSPEAPKEILFRRLFFNLTGLPPSLEEIEEFLGDNAPESYALWVDRVLAFPAYGERMAVDWLDLARYADTYGYQADVDRDMSAWRDWVISAFNRNLPYDQFLAWQIAGDLLPEAKDEQVLATAFNRLHRQTNEGGSIEEEFRAEYVADRIHTMGTAMLGLTLECARCHDHKFDPVTQKDYYRLFAFFNNIDESGLYSHFTRATPTPTSLLYGPGAKGQHADLRGQIAETEESLVQIAASAQPRFQEWLKAGRTLIRRPAPSASFSFEQFETNTTLNAVGTNHAQLVEQPAKVRGSVGQALQFNGENSVVCKEAGHFKRTDPFSIGLWIRRTQAQDRTVLFHRSRAWTDSASRGYELLLEQGRPSFALIHFWPGNAIRILAHEALPLETWVHLAVTYDGSSRAHGMRIYRNGEPMAAEIIRDHLYKDIVHRKEWGDSDVGNLHLTLAARFRDSGFKNGIMDELEVFDQCLTPLEVKSLVVGDTTPLHENIPDGALFTHYLQRHDPEYAKAQAALLTLREQENSLVNDVPEIMVMRERHQTRAAFVLQRGAYDAPGERVDPGVPETILPFPDEFPSNRLGLASWLVDPRNPLTARVAVNRIWRMHFGRGLVATPEDFGSQGQLPTHPELLDWLAQTFMESGWDVKRLHKLIVTSSTFRQSSAAPPELVAADPDNHWLARGPKRRLLAEQIRDAALAVSGLLSRHMGGPSVKPYQPAGLWEQSGTGKTYHQDHGEKLYRRSLYTFWRRTAPPPSMLTFDAMTREVCTAKRETTATPLQSLVLMNDTQFVEAARVWGERLARTHGRDIETSIQTAFRAATGRPPQPRELEVLQRLCREQRDYFNAHPEDAEKLLKAGEFPRDPSVPAPAAAALAILANTLMNYDEFVMIR